MRIIKYNYETDFQPENLLEIIEHNSSWLVTVPLHPPATSILSAPIVLYKNPLQKYLFYSKQSYEVDISNKFITKVPEPELMYGYKLQFASLSELPHFGIILEPFINAGYCVRF